MIAAGAEVPHVVVGFYYIHPRAHKLGQSLCDSLGQCRSAMPPAVLGITFTLADPDPLITPSAHRTPPQGRHPTGKKSMSSPLAESSREDTRAPLASNSGRKRIK